MEPSRLTKFLEWGERQRFVVQVVIVLPLATLVGIPTLCAKKYTRWVISNLKKVSKS